MRVRRAALGAVGMVLVFVGGWAGAAFACTPQSQVLAPAEAAPGATVQVEGRAVTGGPVEIRWNGVKGTVLATAVPVEGALSVPVQIPTATPPGVYALTLVAPNGQVGRTALEVAAPGLVRNDEAARLWGDASRTSAAAPASGFSTLAVALLSVGLVTLFAASTVAVVRRRHAPVNRQP